jgi:hypothetical protein
LTEDEKKKRKLAKKEIDVESIDPYHLRNYSQINGLKRKDDSVI